MRCTSPRSVGFKADGRTICWSPKQISKEYATFQLPCGKCIECRLDYARQWAVRCVHEAAMHPKNSFITLTYDDNHVGDGRLHYDHFQKFMKKLRKLQSEPMGVFVTGEYGEKTKRPHWHAILFNFDFSDHQPLRTNERGDRIYTSRTLDRIWAKGMAEIGSVTFESAGYCARYAAKKLCHGKDSEHDYQPISKKSSKHAIGKAWLEKNWRDVFINDELVLADGTTTAIPRYYVKWLQEHQPTEWLRYVTETREKKISRAELRAAEEKAAYEATYLERSVRAAKGGYLLGAPTTRNQHRKKITLSKFKLLQDYLKL